MKNRHDRARTALIAVLILVFVASLGVFLYPKISGVILDKEMRETTRSIAERIMCAREEHEASYGSAIGFDHALSNEIPRYNGLLWDAMVAYNKDIWARLQADLNDPWAYEQPSFILGDYGIEDEAFGVLMIPALDLEMPLYLGASYAHMAAGAAHLSQTSLPIGGENTNCVIAGHCGWKGATYFRHLTDLQLGDAVYVLNLWDTLEYRVVETRVIEPTDISGVLIQPGRDLLTLFTCYGRSAKQRYAVYCERVP